MKALINGQIYKVNHGWELDLHNDEQFDSGTIAIQLLNNVPLKNYTYVNLWESNDSYLEFIGTASTSMPIATSTIIRTIYLDIDLSVVTGNFINLGNSQILSMDSGKLVFSNATQQSETSAVLVTGRQKIMIAFIGSKFEIFINGIKQVITTPSNFVDSLTIETVAIGGASTNYKVYDLRLTASVMSEEDILELVNDNYNIDNFMDYNDTNYVYTDFKEDYTVGSTWGIKNLGTTLFGDLGQFQVNIFPVKEWNFFTQTPKAMWFDRESNMYQHTTPLIELIDWFTTIKTPFMDISNPITGTARFTNIQDMIEHIYNVAFPELEGINVGFAYTQDLLNAMVGVDAFDINIPGGNLLSALSIVFNELSGRPTIEKMELGQITLGIKFKSKVNNEIQFNDYDGYESYNPTKGYGAIGEIQGLNVVNNSPDGNKNAYLYTVDMAISMRSESVDITEDNMVTKLFYPIEVIDSVIFYELDNPTNTVDLTNYVVLDSEWKLLKSSGFSSGTTTKYRQNTIKYTKGGTTLDGWGEDYYRFILSNFRTWKEIIKSAQNNASIPVDVPSSWEDISVVVNYRTRNPQTMFRIAKEDISNVSRHSTLQTNQSGNIVDSKRLTNVLHSDIQSSGNRIIHYTRSALETINEALDRDLNDIDTLTNSMIKAIKVSGFEKSYTTVYTLSQDYQSITENLDISAKVRQYNIPDGVETLRYYEDYIEWNLQGIEGNESSVTADGIEAFMGTFGKTNALVKTNIDNVEIVSTEIVDEDSVVQNLIIPVDGDGYRNTLKLFFGFTDPTFAYDKKDTTDIGSTDVIKTSQGIRYTDSQGYLDTVELRYGKKYTATDRLTIDKLPVVDVAKYTGNPLIELGIVTSYNINVPQNPITRFVSTGTTVVARNEQWSIPIDKPTAVTKSIDFVYDDDSTVTYGTKTIQVETVSILDVVTDLGTQNITEGSTMTININTQIKSIILTLVVVATKQVDDIYFNTINTSYLQEVVVSSGGLQISLGSGDIWRHNHFMHNVYYQQGASLIGDIIIGDESMVNNLLVGGIAKDPVIDLKVYESERYDKLERVEVKGTVKGTVNSLITFGTQSIQCDAVIANGKAWAIGDATTGKLLLAVNPPRDIGGVPLAVKKKASLNFVHFRTGLTRDY